MTRGVLLTESSFLFLGRSAWRQPPVPVALNHAPFLFQRQPFLLHWLFMPQGGGETGFLVARPLPLDLANAVAVQPAFVLVLGMVSWVVKQRVRTL